MSSGLMCLRCRACLAQCACDHPLPSLDAKTPLDGAEDGVTPQRASYLVEREKWAIGEAQRRSGLSRAERRRLEREDEKRWSRYDRGLL